MWVRAVWYSFDLWASTCSSVCDGDKLLVSKEITRSKTLTILLPQVSNTPRSKTSDDCFSDQGKNRHIIITCIIIIVVVVVVVIIIIINAAVVISWSLNNYGDFS